ncbi:hypothetical protein T440DRAFT_466822 [Plenodomus tracheiphilus IPT5]|uniref:Uncharacterized protein n=1 Tax=Plenodomus tracheiphilus IPT5 TaxID=1408161 RepID=A0A6A7BBD8_9PLEO|nr:hypothetical protein T440DRAFT_466822 [Plenodomus tracheiphilus IPT5]
MAPKQTSKPVFKTSTPFTETKWPQIAQEHHEIILDLVCNLIAPLGDHRRTHIPPSKGRKRKRISNPDPKQTTPPQSDAPPPPPELSKHILTGVNTITRHLERLVSRNAPTALAASNAPSAALCSADKAPRTKPDDDELAIIILTHPKPASSPAHAHIPTLVHISTISPHVATPVPMAINTKTRLVPLSTSSDSRLASKLGIPRVGALAVMNSAPGAKALVEYVREHVDLTECAWVDEAMTPVWKGLNVTMEMGKGGEKKVNSVM